MSRIRPHLSYANVMATIAVVIALGGTSYAALNLPQHSVGTKQLKPHAVTSSRLGAGAVTRSRLHDRAVNGAKVADHSLTGKDVNLAQLGTVPSAAHAGSADVATNASRLSGLSAAQLTDRCPAGTVLDAGGCIERAARTATDYVGAADDCGASPTGTGRRLPTVAELKSYRQHFGSSDPTDVEWTSDLASTGADPSGALVNVNNGTISFDTLNHAHKYRCVVAPRNG